MLLHCSHIGLAGGFGQIRIVHHIITGCLYSCHLLFGILFVLYVSVVRLIHGLIFFILAIAELILQLHIPIFISGGEKLSHACRHLTHQGMHHLMPQHLSSEGGSGVHGTIQMDVISLGIGSLPVQILMGNTHFGEVRIQGFPQILCQFLFTFRLFCNPKRQLICFLFIIMPFAYFLHQVFSSSSG